MRSSNLKKKKKKKTNSQGRNDEENKGKGSLPEPARMGVAGMAETGTEGVVGGMVEAMPTSAATPNPSKVSANKEMGIRITKETIAGE